MDFPVEWPGDYTEFVRPKSREILVKKTLVPIDLEDATRMVTAVRFLAIQLHKTMQKIGGHHLFQLGEMQKIFGVVDGLVPEDIPAGGRFVPTVIEAFSMLNSDLFKVVTAEPDKSRRILVIGDSTDGLLYANLIHGQISKVLVEWLVVREHLGFEGTIRNYFHHSDAAYAYKPERCINVDPEELQFGDALKDILGHYPRLSKLIFLNASGSEVLENKYRIDSYATVDRALNWLKMGMIVCSKTLAKEGNMVVRMNLLGLTNSACICALCDLMQLFNTCKLVAPALGVDSGIIYVIMKDFQGHSPVTGVCFGSVPGSDDNPIVSPEVYGFLRQCVSFIQHSVVSNILFLDSLLGMINMNKKRLQDLGKSLKSLRDEDSSYKPDQMDILIKGIRFMLCQYRKTHSTLLNWHNEESMPRELWIKPPPFFEQIGIDKKSIHVDVYLAIQSAKGNRNQGLEIMRQLRKIRIEHWDYKALPYIAFGQACVLMNGLDLKKIKDEKKYKVVWGSRWCLSSLVPVRAAFKTILMDNHSKKCLKKDIRSCFECQPLNNSKLKLIKVLADKVKEGASSPDHKKILQLYEKDESSFVFACFTEDYVSFVTKTDLECAYERTKQMMTILENLPLNGSAYICSFPMLTRIDAGVVFLLTAMFKDVYLVGCNFRPVTFGIFFYNLMDKAEMKSVILEHVQACIEAQKTEIVDFEELDCFFGLAYLNQWNSHVVGHSIRMQEENLYEAE